MILYMIRSKKTGLYSKGGNDVTWSKLGKIWASRNALSNHFTQLTATGRSKYLDNNAELLVVDMLGVPAFTTIEQELAAVNERKAIRKAAERRMIEKYRVKHDLS